MYGGDRFGPTPVLHYIADPVYSYGIFGISYNLMHFIESSRKNPAWWHAERKPLRERLAQ